MTSDKQTQIVTKSGFKDGETPLFISQNSLQSRFYSFVIVKEMKNLIFGKIALLDALL